MDSESWMRRRRQDKPHESDWHAEKEEERVFFHKEIEIYDFGGENILWFYGL